MHDFHSETCSVEDVSPGVDDVAVRRLDGLVEVEAIQVKSHSADTKSSKPDADNRPRCQEEVQ
jgi:hypothetical protein